MFKFKTLVAVVALSLASFTASADQFEEVITGSPSAGAMAFDLIVVRPVSLVASVLGLGLWVVQLPLNGIEAAATGEWPPEAGEQLVVKPFAYTFTRPVGEMDE